MSPYFSCRLWWLVLRWTHDERSARAQSVEAHLLPPFPDFTMDPSQDLLVLIETMYVPPLSTHPLISTSQAHTSHSSFLRTTSALLLKSQVDPSVVTPTRSTSTPSRPSNLILSPRSRSSPGLTGCRVHGRPRSSRFRTRWSLCTRTRRRRLRRREGWRFGIGRGG